MSEVVIAAQSTMETGLRRSMRSPLVTKKRILAEACPNTDNQRVTRSKVAPLEWTALFKPLPMMKMLEDAEADGGKTEDDDDDYAPEEQEEVAEEYDDSDLVRERELEADPTEIATEVDPTLMDELEAADKDEEDEEDEEFTPEDEDEDEDDEDDEADEAELVAEEDEEEAVEEEEEEEDEDEEVEA